MIKRRVIDYIRQQSRYQNLSINIGNDVAEEDNQGYTIEDELSLDDFRKKRNKSLEKKK